MGQIIIDTTGITKALNEPLIRARIIEHFPQFIGVNTFDFLRSIGFEITESGGFAATGTGDYIISFGLRIRSTEFNASTSGAFNGERLGHADSP